MAAERLLTVNEVAQQLRLSSETVRRWLRSGRLKGQVWSDRAGWRITESEVERFLRDGPTHDKD